MMKNFEEWMALLPFWSNLDAVERGMVENSLVEKTFAKGELLSSSGTSCMGLVIVLEGDVRVSILSEDGRQITLFHVLERETCVTTASCVIQQISFESVVTAVVDTTLCVIPAFVLSKLAERNIYVKSYLYERLTERFSTVIWVMEQILFKRIDQRVAAYLVSSYEKTGSIEIHMTQEEMADEINTAREVVARMLKQFAEDGLVELKRGRLLLRDIEGLRNCR